MADTALPVGGVQPVSVGVDQQTLNRRLVQAASGKSGQVFGPSWRAIEARFPTSNDEPCLLFQVRTRTGWKVVSVLHPDGTMAPPP